MDLKKLTDEELRKLAIEAGYKNHSRYSKNDFICKLPNKTLPLRRNQVCVEVQTDLTYCDICYLKTMIKRYEAAEALEG